ncbi:MAG: hypothetical protein WC197_00595 [Candidatus Gastranaerophilaceae bacterium]|jgi:hypothetical protein
MFLAFFGEINILDQINYVDTEFVKIEYCDIIVSTKNYKKIGITYKWRGNNLCIIIFFDIFYSGA